MVKTLKFVTHILPNRTLGYLFFPVATAEVVDIDLALAAKTTTTVPKAARSLESTRIFTGGGWVLEDDFYGMFFVFPGALFCDSCNYLADK